MPRLRSRTLVPTLALIALGFLVPALARALPMGDVVLSIAERHEAAPGRFSQLWSLLSTLWAETGSILEPDSTTGSGSGTGAEPGTANSSDNGPGLDPDGS